MAGRVLIRIWSIVLFAASLLIGKSGAFSYRAASGSSLTRPCQGRATCTFPHETSFQKDTALSMRGSGNEIEGTDRILSCLPYLVPLMDGDRYGRFLFAILPPLGLADAILLGPFKLVYGAIPFAQLIAFFGLSILSRNTDISRPIRFNMQQALILDIMLIFPSLFGGLANSVPRVLVESGSNFVFYALVGAVGYSLVSNLTGKVPNQIPIVSDATEMQIGPF